MTNKQKVQIGGWGEIDECCICKKQHIGGVIPFPEDDLKIGDEICYDCLHKKCEVVGNIKIDDLPA